jgi:methionyl-tRNA formyltransferase
VRIVFAGTPEVAVPSLQALAAAPAHELLAVVTRPDAPAGRGKRLAPSPVAVAAERMGLEVLKPQHPRDLDFQARLKALAPAAVAVVAYGALLPESALAIPEHGWINLHFSVLPAWRGAAPVQHAIWHGDEVTGATTFRIVKELDAGPVFGVMTYGIGPRTTAGELLDVLARDGAGLLVATMDAIAQGTARAVPQAGEGTSYAAKITPADAQVDWTRPDFAVDRQVRACTPQPGAWTVFRDERLKLGPVLPGRLASHLPLNLGCEGQALRPGELAADKHHVWVGTGTVPVELADVAPAGKGWMAAEAWARGVRPEFGEMVGEQ